MTTEHETGQPSGDGDVRPPNRTLAHGWYWVRFERSNSELTAPMPAQWDGQHWCSVGWSGLPLGRALVLEPCALPGVDPLQGAADWLCQAFEEPSVADIQRQLRIGYNRAARLFAQAMKDSGCTSTSYTSAPLR